MLERIDYYILPLKESLPFRYIDVLRSINDRLKKIPKFENTIVEFELWDTYVWSPRTLEIDSRFVWRSPEVEMLRVNFKENDSTSLSMEIDCDLLSYYLDIEDIFVDSQVLNENQESHIQEDGYYFWKFSVWENETQSIYLETLITVLLDLSNGIVSSCKGNWEVVLHPSFNFNTSWIF